jgi:hypothetical protein
MTSTSVTKRPFEGERIVIRTTLGFDATCEAFRRLLGNSSFSDLAELSRSSLTQADFENQVQARFVGESGFMRFGPFADIEVCDIDVCFALKSRHSPTRFSCPLSARSRHVRSPRATVDLPHCDGILGPPGYCPAQTTKVIGREGPRSNTSEPKRRSPYRLDFHRLLYAGAAENHWDKLQ